MDSQHRVLVVDDDEAMATMLVDLLQTSGHSCAAAGSALEAADRPEDGGFTLIVSDVQMQPYDGLDLLEMLIARQISTPVILMSAFAGPDVERRALANGARAFLVKPFDPASLVDLVDSIEPGQARAHPRC